MAGWSWKSWDLFNLIFPFGPGAGPVWPSRQSRGGRSHHRVPSPRADLCFVPPSFPPSIQSIFSQAVLSLMFDIIISVLAIINIYY